MPTTSSPNGGVAMTIDEPKSGQTGESVLAQGIRAVATRLDRLIRDFKAGAVPVAEVVARLYELEQEIVRLRGDR